MKPASITAQNAKPPTNGKRKSIYPQNPAEKGIILTNQRKTLYKLANINNFADILDRKG
jgi:hypothetical protein